MKVEIKKLPSGNVALTIAVSTSKKPIVFELTPAEVQTAIKFVEIASKSDSFSFAYETNG